LSTEQKQKTDTFFRITDTFHESYSYFPSSFLAERSIHFGDKESDAHISYPFISIHFLPVQPTKGHIFRKSEKMEHRSIPVLHF